MKTDDWIISHRSKSAASWGDANAPLDDLREAVTTLEETERIARRVLGGAHPVLVDNERRLRMSRAALRVRETLSTGST